MTTFTIDVSGQLEAKVKPDPYLPDQQPMPVAPQHAGQLILTSGAFTTTAGALLVSIGNAASLGTGLLVAGGLAATAGVAFLVTDVLSNMRKRKLQVRVTAQTK